MSDLFQLPEFIDSRGKLTFVEEVTHLPFQIRAVYLLAKEDIPDKILLPSHAFLMAPVGNIMVNSDTILHGINNGILTKPAEDIYLDKSSDSFLLILSEKTISHLTPLQIPFRARRAYFMTDIHKGKSRGNHAHLTTSQLIYSLQGAFEVELDNGTAKKSVRLTSPDFPVEAPIGVWHTLQKFTSDAVCMVFASELFNPDDYISEYSEFLDIIKSSNLKND